MPTTSRGSAPITSGASRRSTTKATAREASWPPVMASPQPDEPVARLQPDEGQRPDLAVVVRLRVAHGECLDAVDSHPSSLCVEIRRTCSGRPPLRRASVLDGRFYPAWTPAAPGPPAVTRR